jgi:hypothetical protein
MRSAVVVAVLRPKADRRVVPDRRARPRGGRRAGDHPNMPSANVACDGCGSTELQYVGTTRGFDEYRCRVCHCRLFRLRDLW